MKRTGYIGIRGMQKRPNDHERADWEGFNGVFWKREKGEGGICKLRKGGARRKNPGREIVSQILGLRQLPLWACLKWEEK